MASGWPGFRPSAMLLSRRVRPRFSGEKTVITLYGKVRSRAARCLWALEEASVLYRHVPTDYATGDNRRPEYLALNPNGTLPTLTDGDLAVWESVAINLYIARTYGRELWPRTPAGEAHTYQWGIWGLLEIEARLDVMIGETLFKAPGQCDRAAIEKAEKGLAKPLGILDAELGKRRYLVEDRFTIADLNMASILDAGAYVDFRYDAYPAIGSYLVRCHDRPAFRKVLAMAA